MLKGMKTVKFFLVLLALFCKSYIVTVFKNYYKSLMLQLSELCDFQTLLLNSLAPQKFLKSVSFEM